MKKRFWVLALFITLVASSKGMAQDYHTGLGVRGGYAWGISAKHFFSTDAALEGILTARWNGFKITGLGEIHLPVFDTEGFYFYYGAGAHLGIWDSQVDYFGSDTGGNRLFLGVDGIAGLEYAFYDIPMSIGLDWKPGFNIISDFGFAFDEIALSVRYLFR